MTDVTRKYWFKNRKISVCTRLFLILNAGPDLQLCSGLRRVCVLRVAFTFRG